MISIESDRDNLPGDVAAIVLDADDGVGDVTSVSNARHASGYHGDCGGYYGCYGWHGQGRHHVDPGMLMHGLRSVDYFCACCLQNCVDARAADVGDEVAESR